MSAVAASEDGPSVGHIIGHGFLNFYNQVFLLMYKNITRLFRSPWAVIFLIFFPSMLLGILYGIQNTVVANSGNFLSDDLGPKQPSRCSISDAPYPMKSCITLAWVDDSGNSSKAAANYGAIRLAAKKYGWSIAPFNDTSLGYDVVYFGTNRTSFEQGYYTGTFWAKYIVTHKADSLFGRDWQDYDRNPLTYQAQVLGPQDYPMGGFGFRNRFPNADKTSTPILVNLLMDAEIAYAQAMTNGWKGDQAILPDMQLNYESIRSSSSSTSDSTYNTENMIWTIGGPLVLWVSFFASQLYLTSQVVEDRRKKLRLGMVMMGLNTGAYQLSWFLYHMLISLIYSLIAFGIGYACKFSFFLNVNPVVVILTYWCTSCAAIGFALMITAMVHHPTGCMSLIIVSFLVGMALVGVQPPLVGDGFWQFPSSTAIWAFNYNFQFAHIMTSISHVLQNQNSTFTPYYGWTMATTSQPLRVGYMQYINMPSVMESCGWLVFCGVIAFLFSLYLEIVFPREIGSPQGFFFFVLPSYWGFDTRSRLNVETVAHRANKMSDVAVDLDPDILAEFNDVMTRTASGDPTLALAITKLSKTFQKGRTASDNDTRAVDNVTLGADTGSVLGIVGHNGAGKSTLLSMLCGVVTATVGDARVFGHSISQNMTSIHNVMGVCPQDDVLWPELTPAEHLKLFAMLKRVPWSKHEQVISDSLNEVGLLHVKDRMANKLSGGMKRRLSVAIALMGNIRIIMLDEPTAGLDPRNRLEIWSIIERIKKNRVVILTTHSMQEASTLSDKIVVMAVGRIRGVGTAQHLIQRFGKGHQISVICKVSKNDEVKALVQKLLPDANLEVDTGARLTYSLAASKSRQLPDFCRAMESAHDVETLIEDWGISQTTMEAVFLKLTHGGGNTDGLSANGGAMQLNISLEKSDDVLGFVPITPSSTLDDVRESMRTLDGMPTNFTFIFNKAPVATHQERSTSAYKALPLIELRLAAGSPQPVAAVASPSNSMDDFDSSFASSSSHSDSVPALKARIAELEAQVRDRDTLVATIQQLQQEIATLKLQLASLQ